LGEPTSYTDGPNLGLTWCYFMAPWGQQLEIVSAPNGTVFDREAKAAGKTRLFHPKYVAETTIDFFVLIERGGSMRPASLYLRWTSINLFL